MLIRPFRPDDAPFLASLFVESVRRIGARDYSPAQVAAWSARRPDPEAFVRRAKASTFLVAVDGSGAVAGYGILKSDGHLDHLYRRADPAGSGAGSALLAALEASARAAAIARLHTEASEAARRLLLRRGWTCDGRNDFAIDGVAIHNFRMSKILAPRA